MIGKTRRWAGMGAAPMLASALALAVAGLVPQVAHAAPDGESADVGTDGNRPIRVIGHPDPEGLLPDTAAPKAVSAIGAAFIEKQAATFNAYQLVNILPGANVASTDPFGLSTSSSLTLRGLGQDAIGVTMEGAPQNDIGYYVAYPAQFADPENIARVELSQGSADIASPVVNAVGGLLALSLDAPHRDFGVLADASLGSFNERRVRGWTAATWGRPAARLRVLFQQPRRQLARPRRGQAPAYRRQDHGRMGQRQHREPFRLVQRCQQFHLSEPKPGRLAGAGARL
jgi:iron complex outermembrane receptor protein